MSFLKFPELSGLLEIISIERISAYGSRCVVDKSSYHPLKSKKIGIHFGMKIRLHKDTGRASSKSVLKKETYAIS